MNALFFISAYRTGQIWMFDDEQRGIKGEPFVLGASEFIQRHLDAKGITETKDIPLIFSLEPFPDQEVVLVCTEKCKPLKLNGYKNKKPVFTENKTAEPNSAWYVDNTGHKLWLCPAQIKFFGKVADTIFAKIG